MKNTYISNHLFYFNTVCPINPKLAWIIQELPGFLIPTLFLYESWTNLNLSTKILLICFILHYFNRYMKQNISWYIKETKHTFKIFPGALYFQLL